MPVKAHLKNVKVAIGRVVSGTTSPVACLAAGTDGCPSSGVTAHDGKLQPPASTTLPTFGWAGRSCLTAGPSSMTAIWPLRLAPLAVRQVGEELDCNDAFLGGSSASAMEKWAQKASTAECM
mmetsp:Transcript_76558/g.212653  ORF Transcript_76558/g.212653 Transcript_76558/m.212653 type:complete len:122 (-) Transcript_76558:68-433(-)